MHSYSLLKAIKNHGYDGSILTTYNCHIPFIEEVVIRKLASVGCRHNIVLADHSQLNAAFENHLPKRVGRDYILLPIKQKTAFHPKIILLAGKNKGFLAIGSHNLTYSGFSYNREITNVFTYQEKKQEEHLTDFQYVWRKLSNIINECNPSNYEDYNNLLGRLSELAPWLNGEKASSKRIFFAGKSEKSIYSKLLNKIEPDVKEIIIGGAFFDSKMEFIKKVITNFNTKNVIIPIDVNTVSLPPIAKDITGVSFVDASHLAKYSKRYLHAKFIYIREDKSNSRFISGSANPSKPAWLNSDDQANTECVCMIENEAANTAIKQLGIDELIRSKKISKVDWDTINKNWDNNLPTEHEDSFKILFAFLVDNQEIRFDLDENVNEYAVRFINNDGEPLESQYEISKIDAVTRVKGKNLDEVSHIQLIKNDTIKFHFIVNQLDTLSEHTRTGDYHKFTNALTSLTDSPDSPEVKDLFKYLDLLFVKNIKSSGNRLGRKTPKKVKIVEEITDTLAISIKEILLSENRKRISTRTGAGDAVDFINALNAIIRQSGTPNSEKDSFSDNKGRTEEESSGEDDEDFQDRDATPLVEGFHRKVRTLVNRCIKNIDAFSEGKLEFDILVIQLTAILGVLKWFRMNDGNYWWVNTELGETTVPINELEKLVDPIFTHLISDSKFTYPGLEVTNETIQSEEIGILKMLIFWMMSEAGIKIDWQYKFNERTPDLKDRIKKNGEYIALGEMIKKDQLALKELEKTSNESSPQFRRNFNNLKILSYGIDKLINSGNHAKSVPEVGDIVYHRKLPKLGYRTIVSIERNKVTLNSIGSDSQNSFLKDHLEIYSYEALMQYTNTDAN